MSPLPAQTASIAFVALSLKVRIQSTSSKDSVKVVPSCVEPLVAITVTVDG